MDIHLLPDELVIQILSATDVKSLLKCSQANKYFHSLAQSRLLHYNATLCRSGMRSVQTANFTPAAALDMLNDYNDRWNTITPMKTFTIDLFEPCNAYELVGGLFVSAMANERSVGFDASRKLTIVDLPTSGSEMGEKPVRVIEDLGCEVRDFALDPGQDLLILLEHELNLRDPPGIYMRVRTLSSNLPHPLAKYDTAPACTGPGTIFDLGTPYLQGAEMQIAHDLVALHTHRRLIIWNWMTGKRTAAWEFRHQEHADFDFISPRAFMLTSSYSPCLRLCTLVDTEDGDGAISMNHELSLHLPDPFKQAVEFHMWTHTSPLVTTKPGDASGRTGLPFEPSRESRIHVLTVDVLPELGEEQHLFLVAVRGADLLKLVEDRKDRSRECGVDVKWEDWGPRITHWHKTERMHNWLRYVHGGRYIHPSRPVFGDGTDTIRITDFSALPDPVQATSRRRRVSSGRASEVRLFKELHLPHPSQGEFEKEQMAALPARHLYSASGFPLADYTGFMMDDKRILGFKTNGEALSSIDVFCFA